MAYQPKSYKKFVATAATATLVATAVVPAAFADEVKTAADFSDVAPQYKEAVDYLVDQKIAAGKTPSTFGTAEPIIRIDAAVWIAKAVLDEGEISAAPASKFTDVPDRAKIYVDALKAAGYVNGQSDTKYNSYAEITRGEAALILAEAYDLQGDTAKNTFTDVNSRYLAAVSALKDNGITSGKTTTRFGTNDDITRGELAVWVHKLETLHTLSVSNVAVAVDGSNATVTADVKNAAADANATVSVYPNGDLSATPIVNTVKVVDGKVSSTFGEVPAGTHTVVVKVGDATSSKAFTIAAPTTPQVASVTSLNATQVEVKFNTPVTASSVIAPSGVASPEVAGTLVDGVFTFATLDGNAVTANSATAKLSDDKKTLTITAPTTTVNNVTTQQVFEGRYDVTVNGAKDANGKAVEKFVKVIDFKEDVTAPVISNTEKVSANLVKVSFSEPLRTLGTVSFALENGTVVTGIAPTANFTAGDTSVTYNLANAQVNGTALATGVNVVATIVGAQDQNLNILTPNPAKVTFNKGAKDGVAPTVSTVTQTGAKEFTVKFSEELISTPTITVNNSSTGVVIEQDEDDATKYVVTTPNVLDGATTVGVAANFTDLSGEQGAAYSKVYTFVKDVVAAKVVSTNVVQDTTDGKQYLEFTFDKDVELATGNTPASVNVKGTQVENFVTVNVDQTAPVAFKSASNDKVIRVALSTLLGSGTAYNTGAVYDLDATFAGVTSKTGVAVDSTTADFTLVADGTPSVSDKVEVASVVQGSNNNTVIVNFNGNVDLATATNAANYTVDGAVVESATASSATTSAITLTLKNGSNTFTGIRNVTVKNVKKLNGAVPMDTQTVVSGSLNENVSPTITSAVLTATNTVEVTFSENVKNGGLTDFVLNVGGVATTATVTTETQANATDNKLVLTLAPAITAADLAKGLSLTAASSLDITDAVNNKVSVPTAVTIAQ